MSTKQGAPVTSTSASGTPAGHSRRFPTPPSNSSSKGSDGPLSGSLQPPPLPYLRNAHFDIKPHNPLPPFDNGGGYENPDPKEWNPNPWPFGDDAPKGIVTQYLAHPPRNSRNPRDKTFLRTRLSVTWKSPSRSAAATTAWLRWCGVSWMERSVSLRSSTPCMLGLIDVTSMDFRPHTTRSASTRARRLHIRGSRRAAWMDDTPPSFMVVGSSSYYYLLAREMWSVARSA